MADEKLGEAKRFYESLARAPFVPASQLHQHVINAQNLLLSGSPTSTQYLKSLQIGEVITFSLGYELDEAHVHHAQQHITQHKAITICHDIDDSLLPLQAVFCTPRPDKAPLNLAIKQFIDSIQKEKIIDHRLCSARSDDFNKPSKHPEHSLVSTPSICQALQDWDITLNPSETKYIFTNGSHDKLEHILNKFYDDSDPTAATIHPLLIIIDDNPYVHSYKEQYASELDENNITLVMIKVLLPGEYHSSHLDLAYQFCHQHLKLKLLQIQDSPVSVNTGRNKKKREAINALKDDRVQQFPKISLE